MKHQLSQYIRGILKTWDKNFEGSGASNRKQKHINKTKNIELYS